jgi:hypothetical protein
VPSVFINESEVGIKVIDSNNCIIQSLVNLWVNIFRVVVETI